MAAPKPTTSQQFGKYQLVERLGRGGMAEVWKARVVGPAGFARTLVVKRILPHLVEDPHFVQMFVTEARLSARLNHNNIVQVYELGDVDGEYFLAMEYVRGRDLVTAIRQHLLRGSPPPALGAFVIREVCRALGYAHAMTDDNGVPLRLIHRDVSPSNVMLSFDGAVKLLDFGIAKALADSNESKTQTGTLKGKFGYMAPEQVEGRDFDHRADLFAAGIVLHESLTGRRLFKGASDLQTLAMVRDARVDPPSVLNDQVPPELDRICLKALARMPDDRYRTGDEMAVELDEVVHQMKWGPERLSSALKDLFPDEPSMTSTQVPMLADPTGLGEMSRGAFQRYRRRRWLVSGVTALAIIGGMALLLLARQPIGEKKTASLPAPVVALPVPARPEPPRDVTVRVISQPSGADVFLGSEPSSRGKTPINLHLPRADGARTLRLTARGYQNAMAEVSTAVDSQVQLSLPRIVAPAAPPAWHPPRKKASAKAVNGGRPTAPPDIKRGDVVDPFAR